MLSFNMHTFSVPFKWNSLHGLTILRFRSLVQGVSVISVVCVPTLISYNIVFLW
jgi:hypothetical protein